MCVSFNVRTPVAPTDTVELSNSSSRLRCGGGLYRCAQLIYAETQQRPTEAKQHSGLIIRVHSAALRWMGQQ